MSNILDRMMILARKRWVTAVFLALAANLAGQEGLTNKAPAGQLKLRDVFSTNSVLTNTTYKTPEGQILTFPVPLSPAARTSVLNSKNPMVDIALGAIAVPLGFDREIPTPILLVNGTSDGDGSSVRAMRAYTNVALRLGWIVIAADGPLGKPPDDNPPWRWAMISSLLEHIHAAWPGSKRWPIASAGVSGGGKWAGVIGGILAHRGYNLAGVFMAAVNEDYASETAKLYDPAMKFKQAPVYLSSGTDDKLATVKHHTEVRESLLHHGFSSVRLETFKGGHALSEMELRKALKWFLEQYGRDPNAPPSAPPDAAATEAAASSAPPLEPEPATEPKIEP